jgi:carbonic anhydrase/acetyltransferase-like protein (isoleucine patch superfamily)
VLWSGNHVGHRTVIEDHVFVSSHAVISGYCHIGEGSFIGVNATFNDHVKIAPYNVIGAGALVTRDTEPGRVYVGSPAKPVPNRTSFGVRL